MEKEKSEERAGGKEEEWTYPRGGKRKPSNRYEGPIAPVVVSILAVLAWAIFTLLYALFWSTRFTIFQNVIVVMFSLIITGLLIGLMWILLSPKGTWRGK